MRVGGSNRVFVPNCGGRRDLIANGCTVGQLHIREAAFAGSSPRTQGRTNSVYSLSPRSHPRQEQRAYAFTDEGGRFQAVQLERMRPRLTGEDRGVPWNPDFNLDRCSPGERAPAEALGPKDRQTPV